MTFLPLNDRVLIKPDKAPDKTATGIILPDASKEKPTTGTVVCGLREVSKGDVVYYSKYSGTDIEIDGEKYLLVKIDELLGVVK